ncbi:MAG: tetratricopeptide repeat protein [Pyrinomonadaceae bacterium]
MKFQDAPCKYQNLQRKINVVVLSGFFVLLGTLSLQGMVSAQTTTEIEKQLNKTPRKKNTSPPPAGTPKKTAPAPLKKKIVISKANKGKPAPVKVAELQSVVFTTGALEVELWSDGKLIGISDKTGKLTKLMAGGEHQIFARKYDKDLFKPLKITVTQEQNNFDFSADIAKAVDEIGQSQTTDNKIEENDPQPVDANAILKNYQDPQTTDSVTRNDWQSIYDQCRRQGAIGNTNNDIEALSSFAQGQIELSLGNRQKALSLFSAAALYSPNSPIIHYGLGIAQVSAKNINAAATSFDKTIKLDNKFSLAYKERGRIYQDQGRIKEAATYYQQAQKLGDNTPELRLKFAETQIKNKNCAAAVKELEILRTESPSLIGLMALSNCYVEQKRPVSAIETLRKAIELDPNSAEAYYQIGVIYLKQKEYSKAKQSLEKALILDADGKAVNRRELQALIAKAQKRANND